MNRSIYLTGILLFIVASGLIGCEGAIVGTGLKGTVATGAAVQNATVSVKGQDGKTRTTLTNERGKYELDTNDLSGPLY